MKKVDYLNTKYGKLQPLKIHSKDRNGHNRLLCKCDCGETCTVLGTHLVKGAITSCGCSRPKGKNINFFKGYEDISMNFWYNHIIKSANGSKGRRKIELSISIKEAWELYEKQNKKCALSNLPIKFPIKWNDKSYTASLDRIDSSKGYTLDNIQWVHKDINIMKNKFDQDYFMQMCKLIANKNCELK